MIAYLLVPRRDDDISLFVMRNRHQFIFIEDVVHK